MPPSLVHHVDPISETLLDLGWLGCEIQDAQLMSRSEKDTEPALLEN